MNGANQSVSGGIGGFLAFFLLACALWLLMRNMNKRLQNISYDEELRSQRPDGQGRPASAAGGAPLGAAGPIDPGVRRSATGPADGDGGDGAFPSSAG
ncbi:hypothetical protein KEM60_01848 [Austwickia sp. TVS 96-490-7B]|uniref:hypothetical protein n=1 Tax=Austwickia sp. TVS 96-490-7B TaxID=2830843 RepID=UPI001C57CB58|nr:hypothetical protein [Austwickia sp. TVS 96-490-7B]MBW3085644.1 hypothetical protein [Austwickia sp. TVS 96-490-7B]